MIKFDNKVELNDGQKSLEKMINILDFLSENKGAEIEEIEVSELEKNAVDFWSLNRFKDARKAYLFSFYYPYIV